jgi:hypothetical protein
MVRVVGDGADPHAAARDSGCSAFGAGHCSINWRHGHRGTLLPNTAALAPALMQWDEHAATLHEGPMERTPPARLPTVAGTVCAPSCMKDEQRRMNSSHVTSNIPCSYSHEYQFS